MSSVVLNSVALALGTDLEAPAQLPEPRLGSKEEALCFLCMQWTVDGADCHRPWCPETPATTVNAKD
jgi:hypothetical protein